MSDSFVFAHGVDLWALDVLCTVVACDNWGHWKKIKALRTEFQMIEPTEMEYAKSCTFLRISLEKANWDEWFCWAHESLSNVDDTSCHHFPAWVADDAMKIMFVNMIWRWIEFIHDERFKIQF